MLGQILDGRYRVLGKLGDGGMGEVYLVEHVHLGRKEALKILHPFLADDPQLVARFRREARAANRLQHANIVSVHDFGRLPDGRFYLAMEYIEGEDLADVLARVARLPVPRALYILAQLADAVDHAHACGVVHRDLKPENLVLEAARRGRADQLKVLDFGIAKIVAPDYHESFGATPAGEIFGTPAYMAPEQLMGKPVDGRSDLYAVGCIAFELVVGEPPFTGRKIELMHQHLTVPAPKPSARAPGAVPPELDAIVLRCLEKDPARRFSSGRELQNALQLVPGFDAHKPPSGRRRAAASFEVSDTSERDFRRAPGVAEAPTEPISRDDLVESERRLLYEVGERLVDAGHNDLQLVLGIARARKLGDELTAHDAQLEAGELRAAEVEQVGREREAALRFALGELHFERGRSVAAGTPLGPEVDRQMAAFQQQLAQLAAETQRELDALLDRSIALTAARAGVDEKLVALYQSLGRVVEEVVTRVTLDPMLGSLLARWRALRSVLGRAQ